MRGIIDTHSWNDFQNYSLPIRDLISTNVEYNWGNRNCKCVQFYFRFSCIFKFGGTVSPTISYTTIIFLRLIGKAVFLSSITFQYNSYSIDYLKFHTNSLLIVNAHARERRLWRKYCSKSTVPSYFTWTILFQKYFSRKPMSRSNLELWVCLLYINSPYFVLIYIHILLCIPFIIAKTLVFV